MTPATRRPWPSCKPCSAPCRATYSKTAARHLRHTLEHGLPPSAHSILGEQAESTARLLSGMQAKLQDQEKEQHARIAIHHYHCDHLGTLTDQTGQVAWAAKLDSWGNVLQEYNPQGLHQAIRLPGQHHDRETGLYYNRHRYYDPVLGGYVNQDPIGWNGGTNHYDYPVDPLGLQGQGGVGAAASTANKARKSANFGKDVADARQKTKKANQEKSDLYKCIAVPTPPNYQKSAQDLEAMNEQAGESEKEAIKAMREAYKSGLKVPGTLTGGPLAKPIP